MIRPPRSIRTAAFAAAIAVLTLHGSAGRAQPAADDDSTARPGRLARLADGRNINLRCAGQGAPTVVLEGGFAATSLVWGKVQPKLAGAHRVCSYDRAGYGFSDPGPMPRDGAAVAHDLDEALRVAGIDGPFVLVGHSAGALYVRLLADLRPREVVGMVLVDPSVEHQDRRLAAAFGPGAGSLAGPRARAERCLAAAEQGVLPSSDPSLGICTPPARPDQPATVNAARLAEALNPSTWRTQISELDSLWTSTSDEVDHGRPSYGALPLVVLTADGGRPGAPAPMLDASRRFWAALHRELAARSSRGDARWVANTSHMIMTDRPDAIVAAVDDVIAQASARGDTAAGR